VAVIDIGSNSVRLVVFEGGIGQPTAIYNEKVQCGLARDLDMTGVLHAEGVRKAVASLERFVALSEAMGVDRLELLATAAVRDASDGGDFAETLHQMFGLTVRVLSGEEEARLSALGVLWGAPRARGIIGDLGGGSLELVALKEGKIARQATLPLGPLRLLAAVGHDPKAARGVIDKEIDRLDWLDFRGAADFYAVGGAWRAMAQVQMAESAYPLKVIHGYSQPCQVIKNMASASARQTGRPMAGLESLGAGRRETLPLASLVMCRVLSAVRPRNVIFSSFGLREGWLFEQQSEFLLDKDPLIAMAEDCARRGGRFGDRGLALFKWMRPLFPHEGRKRARLRRAVCHFVDIAWREHPEYRATYALERILQWPGLAANHRERAFIAHSLFVRYGGSGVTPVGRTLLSAEDRNQAQLLGLVLRLALTLSVGGATALESTKLILKDGQLVLRQSGMHSLASGEVVERRLGQLRKLIAEFGEDFFLRYKS
jgi:exopolyphosphatase/guanosine-5'-triphosphate,3'-diphosphate pyrophosphatase